MVSDFSTKRVRIDYYKEFVAEHPKHERGYVCLLDELLNANRLEEAENIALLGDCMASYCEYEKAIEYYEKSLELQEKPRFTDSQISIATIYEIMEQKEKAVLAWKKVLDILTNEHQILEGYAVEKIEKEIRRLEKDM